LVVNLLFSYSEVHSNPKSFCVITLRRHIVISSQII